MMAPGYCGMVESLSVQSRQAYVLGEAGDITGEFDVVILSSFPKCNK